MQQMIQQLLAHSVQEGLLDDQFLQLIQLQASAGSREGRLVVLNAPAPASAVLLAAPASPLPVPASHAARVGLDNTHCSCTAARA